MRFFFSFFDMRGLGLLSMDGVEHFGLEVCCLPSLAGVMYIRNGNM